MNTKKNRTKYQKHFNYDCLKLKSALDLQTTTKKERRPLFLYSFMIPMLSGRVCAELCRCFRCRHLSYRSGCDCVIEFIVHFKIRCACFTHVPNSGVCKQVYVSSKHFSTENRFGCVTLFFLSCCHQK